MGCSSFLYGDVIQFEEYDESDYRVQLYTESHAYEFGADETGKPYYYKVQDSTDEYLYLGPNEVFFTPVGGLRLGGEFRNEAIEFTRGREYRHIKGFTKDGSKLEWGMITTAAGPIHADCFLSAFSHSAGSHLELQIDDGEIFTVELTDDVIANGRFELDFPSLQEGFHMFSIKNPEAKKTASLKILNVRLSGEGVSNSYVVRERWRPEAGWTKFICSKNSKDVKAWIFELSSDSKFGHYSPISTNFGYFGPIFLPYGSVQGVNMSIWSSGSSVGLLPVGEQSHLLGIGSSKGYFGTWSHEGFGVKVRGWNPFDNNESGKHVLGLRFTEDGDFLTYYGYFWNEVTKKWQLYSAGRKLKKKSVTSLKLASFIEVVGGAESERSNHVARKVNYRGWAMNSDGEWFDIDQIKHPNKSILTNKKRGISEDGESFYTSTGGLRNQIFEETGEIVQKEEIEERPLYMSEKKLRKFHKLPFNPVIKSVSVDEENQTTIQFQTKISRASKVTVCWGDVDALSNEHNWENTAVLDVPKGKKNKIHSFDIPAQETARYFRILVQNDKAQMWNFETYDRYPPEDQE